MAQYAHTPEYQEDEENEWELLHSIKELEYALQVCQNKPIAPEKEPCDN